MPPQATFSDLVAKSWFVSGTTPSTQLHSEKQVSPPSVRQVGDRPDDNAEHTVRAVCRHEADIDKYRKRSHVRCAPRLNLSLAHTASPKHPKIIPQGPCQQHSMSSASSKATGIASSLSSSLSSALPSATVAAQPTGDPRASTQTIVITTIAVTTTTLLAILAGIYYSGYADDILKAMAKKYYAAKAQAEATALAHTGSEKVQGALKGRYLSPKAHLRTLSLDVTHQPIHSRVLNHDITSHQSPPFVQCSPLPPPSRTILTYCHRVAEEQPSHGRVGARAGEQRSRQGGHGRRCGRREPPAGRSGQKAAVMDRRMERNGGKADNGQRQLASRIRVIGCSARKVRQRHEDGKTRIFRKCWTVVDGYSHVVQCSYLMQSSIWPRKPGMPCAQ